jgi:two-component system, sensor histidine kinase and response regulator
LGITTPEDEALTASPEQGIQLKPLSILLAEDSLLNQRLAVAVLEKHGHQVVVANSGLEALERLQTRQFDLVLMDVQMPDMDGIEATRAIRCQEKQTGKHLPIIAMTAHAMKGDREECLQAGMDGYVAKPIRVQELFGVIQQVLSTCREQAPVPAAPAPALAKTRPARPNGKPLDST